MAVIDNLIVSYDQSETSGSILDSHTNGYNLTETSGTIGSAAGPAGTANTARDYVDTDTEYGTIANASSPLLDITGDMSIVTWVWLNRNDVSMKVLARYDTLGALHAYDLQYSSAGTWIFHVSSGSSFANFTGVASDSSFGTGSWRMITARHHAGVKITITINDDITPNEQAYTHGLWDSGTKFDLGRDEDGQYYHGRIAQTRIWDKVITTDEQTWLYNSGTGRTYAEIVAAAGGGSTPARIIIQKA